MSYATPKAIHVIMYIIYNDIDKMYGLDGG